VQQWLRAQGTSLADPNAPLLLAKELSRQSAMLAFTQVFGMIALSFALMVPLLFLLKGAKRGS
jgi:MFS transporter, DHA2 family, multidrug resistance protein